MVTALLCLFLLSLVSSLGLQAQPPVPFPEGSHPDLVRELFLRVNTHRKEQGLAPLQWDDRITPIALKHSRRMAEGKTRPGHQGMDKRMERLQEKIPGTRGMAENIIIGPEQADRLMEEWLNSPSHRKNMEGNYQLTALAMDRDSKGKVYVTQIFVRY